MLRRSVPISKRAFGRASVVPFEAKANGKTVNGLVTRVGGRYFAFQNLCKHIPVTLDAVDGNVTTED